MSPIKILLTNVLLFTASLLVPVAYAASPTKAVNPRFGTSSTTTTDGSERNGGSLIKESSEGNLFVAGVKGSRFIGMGGVPHKPMLTKLNSKGERIWQRVYERRGWSIIAMDTSATNPALLFWYPQPGSRFRLDKDAKGYSTHGLVELWSLNPSGELDEKFLSIDHEFNNVRVSSYESGFSLLLGKLNSDGNRTVHSYHYDWRGHTTVRHDKFIAPNLPRLLLDKTGALAHGSTGDNFQERVLRYYSFKSKTTTEIPVENCGGCTFHDAIRSSNSIEVLLTRGGYDDPDRRTELAKYDLASKELISTFDLSEFSDLQTVRLHRSRNGDLIVTGKDLTAMVLARLTNKGRRLVWAKRFNTTRGKPAHLVSLVELADGRIAATGAVNTQSEFDSAISLIIDSNGESLAPLTTCLSEGFSLTNLILRLSRQYRVELKIRELRSMVMSNLRSNIWNNSVPENLCPFPNEGELLKFVTTLLELLPPPNPDLQTTKMTITLHALPAKENSQAFYYVPNQRTVQKTPILLVNLNKPKEVAAELTHNVLPYLGLIKKASKPYYQTTRQFFINGNMYVTSNQNNAFNWQHLALNPRNYVDAMDTLNRSYAKLSENEKAEIRRSSDRHHFVYLLPGSGSTGPALLRHLQLPESNVSTFWQWIIERNEQNEPQIATLERRFRDSLNLVFTERPAATPKEYKVFLNQLFNLVKHLEQSPETVELKFTATSGAGYPELQITRKGRCISHAKTSLNATYIATWLESIWTCK